MARTIFDKLLLSSVTDGDWRIWDLSGLSRLTPFRHIGSKQQSSVTVSGYYNCPDLAQFRVAVREIRAKPAPCGPARNCGAWLERVSAELRQGRPEWNKWLACPNLFDLDTRNLYFGQLNQNPRYARLRVGEGARPNWRDSRVCAGTINKCTGKPWEPGPEGRGVKGLPVRLQQVHFTAFSMDGTDNDNDKWSHCAEEQGGEGEQTISTASQEYAAYFLVNNPIGPIPELPEDRDTCCKDGVVCIDSDFQLQRVAGVVYWTSNRWTLSGSEKTAKGDWPKRLVMGARDAGTMFFDQLTQALQAGGGLDTGEKDGQGIKCKPRIVTHVYATQCGMKYNYVELSKVQATDNCPAGIKWTAGIEPIINFTDCRESECSPSETEGVSCGDSGSGSGEESCSSISTTSLPADVTEDQLYGGGQIGCPRNYCPGMGNEQGCGTGCT